MSVDGDVNSLTLTDLQGRRIRAAKGRSIEAPRNAGDLFILTVTRSDGTSVSQKIGF